MPGAKPAWKSLEDSKKPLTFRELPRMRIIMDQLVPRAFPETPHDPEEENPFLRDLDAEMLDSGSAFWLRLIGGANALAVERRSNPVGRNWSGRQDGLRGLRLRFLALLDW